MGFGGILALVVVVAAMGVIGAEPPEHFLIQHSSECYFSANGTGPEEPPGGVRFLDRYIYDRAEYVRFDSDLGQYVAVTPLGEPSARYWNSQKAVLDDARAAVDYFCRHNYGIDAPFASSRRVQPKIKIIPTDHDPSSRHTVLICDVTRFWPSGINITWFRNGKEEKGSHVMTTELIRNGDWTFWIQVMLETKPERGDVYTCQVEHATFATPARVQWEPQSDSARNKMWTGVAGIILGLAFLAPGIILYARNKKGDVLPQTPVALMS